MYDMVIDFDHLGNGVRKVSIVPTSHIFTNSDWITNQHRDTLASHVGHYDQLSFYAVAQNESIERVRIQMLEKIYQPCGP
jgi:splicing factor 3B subunit 5